MLAVSDSKRACPASASSTQHHGTADSRQRVVRCQGPCARIPHCSLPGCTNCKILVQAVDESPAIPTEQLGNYTYTVDSGWVTTPGAVYKYGPNSYAWSAKVGGKEESGDAIASLICCVTLGSRARSQGSASFWYLASGQAKLIQPACMRIVAACCRIPHTYLFQCDAWMRWSLKSCCAPLLRR